VKYLDWVLNSYVLQLKSHTVEPVQLPHCRTARRELPIRVQTIQSLLGNLLFIPFSTLHATFRAALLNTRCQSSHTIEHVSRQWERDCAAWMYRIPERNNAIRPQLETYKMVYEFCAGFWYACEEVVQGSTGSPPVASRHHCLVKIVVSIRWVLNDFPGERWWR
jgi:hypothetical protein